MQELLTLKEIAQELDIPESNLRYYRNRISEFLPSVGRGRRRRYLPEAKDVFQRTVELVQDGMSLERVHKYLSSSEPLEIEQTAHGADREEFLESLSEKIKEKLLNSGVFEEKQAPTAANEQMIEEFGRRIDQTGQRIETIFDELRQKDELLKESSIRIKELEIEKDRLEEDNTRLEKELSARNTEISEKERIIEFQKKKLIEGREKQLGIDEELRRIRAFLESSAGAGSKSTR